MTTIETLTDAQRETLTNAENDAVWHAACDALRIIDQQAARIARAVAILEDEHGVEGNPLKALSALRGQDWP